MTLTEAQQVFEQARSWYKGELKTSNKQYEAPATSKRERFVNFVHGRNTGASRKKRLRRNANREVAFEEINRLRENTKGHTADSKGNYLYNYQIRYGNCHEMACLTAHLVRRKHPTARIYMVDLLDFADHVFVSVNSPPMGANVAGFSRNDAIIIDPWMGVCCEAASYRDHVAEKLDKWALDGKKIIYNGVDLLPNSAFYVADLLQSGLDIRDSSGRPA